MGREFIADFRLPSADLRVFENELEPGAAFLALYQSAIGNRKSAMLFGGGAEN
jgi:hypothetical protein